MFRALGYTRDDWGLLERDLRLHIICHHARPEDTPFGTKWVVRGTMEAPQGGSFGLVSVWMVRRPGGVPSLVTAYPEAREDSP